jgi:quercetin dioxygenase-like cupin family protein
MNNQQALKLLAPHQASAVSISGMIFHFLATSEDTGGAYALMEITILPEIGPPTHRHREQEAFYVLAGEFQFHVGDRTITGTAGTFVNIPSLLFHGWRNVGTSIGRLQCLVTPGGMEGFFQEAGHPVTDATAPPIPPTQADLERQLALTAKYGIEVVPPGDTPNYGFKFTG